VLLAGQEDSIATQRQLLEIPLLEIPDRARLRFTDIAICHKRDQLATSNY
jgi:hypothetical protein